MPLLLSCTHCPRPPAAPYPCLLQNEAEIGAAIRASSIPRSQLFITSKVSPYQQGTEKATAACEASLAALGRPIDLMLVHWPGWVDRKSVV